MTKENLFIIFMCGLFLFSSIGFGQDGDFDGCTVIGVGRLATVDGSVITSHTDCCSECRVHVVHGKKHKKGTMAPVYWGMVHFGKTDERAGRALRDYGTVIGEIPQVERTYTYFHSGYSQMNEHQLAIGESTCSQKSDLETVYIEDVTEQIMTVEQAQVFALQRCKTALDAVKLIGELVETYGFLPSCGGAEALCIADTKELWVMEILSVGTEWEKSSGKPGAIWAAQRVPDDHVVAISNYLRIQEVDPSRPEYLASPNYKQEAIDRGWYDPQSGNNFNWQKAYAPPIREGNLSRMWVVYSAVAPSAKDWPNRKIRGSIHPSAHYFQPREEASFYPFSVKPDKKLSVQDIIAFQRSVSEGTIYDIESDRAWLVPKGEEKFVKSPIATPFPSAPLRDLLRMSSHRNIASHGYGMVAQLRDWLPNAVGGVYWLYVDNPYVSTYVPIYAGVQEIHPYYKTYNIQQYEEGSARWAVDFVDNLLHLRWQDAVKDLHAVREPLENSFFEDQEKVEKEALALHKKSEKKAKKYLTELTNDRMEKIVQMYRDLRVDLITKYSNSRY